MEMAGNPEVRGGLGRRTFSSANRNSSKRFNDTFAFTTCQATTNISS